MSRILNVKDQAVTVGVLDKNVQHVPEYIEITFEDDLGVAHTVFVHRDGPFTDPEAAARAHRDRTLHADPNEPTEHDRPPAPQGETNEPVNRVF